MANTTYTELANAVFDKLKDYDFLKMTEDAAYEVVINYIRPAIVMFENCKQDLSDRDDILKEFNIKLDDNTFVLLTNYMCIQWLTSNFILTSQALKSRLSSADFKALGQKDMLAKALEVRGALKAESDQLAINKSYKKSYLFDIVTNRKKVLK